MESKLQALLIGCGYLGVRVGARLLQRGANVVATTRTQARLEELARHGLQPTRLELSEPEESDVWERRYDHVVYAVAPGRGGDARLAFHDGLVACVERLLEGPPGPPGKLILISSTGVYEETSGGWVDEESPAEPPEERLRWLRRAEEHLRTLARERSFPAAILRLGGIYGPGRSPVEWLRRPEMRARMAGGRRDGWMNWIRVEDAAAATLAALERATPGEIYNVTDGTPVHRADFYGEAARRIGVELPALSTAGSLGKRCSTEKAREELDFTPRYPSYREGLAEL